MIVPKKSLFVFGILAAVLLAGCTGPKDPEPEIKLIGQETGSGGAGSQGYELSDTTTTLQTPPNTTQTQKGPTQMSEKTLADFETIAAQSVTLKTTKGDITFEIYTDKVPLTAQNFLNLAKSGFYDGIVFHRVIDGFMAQVGDPQTKQPGTEAVWGTGGPGYVIADEFVPELKHDGPGVVSMANTGRPTTGGSQFFITHAATEWLNGKHTVFGKVTSGMDVVLALTVGDKIISVSYQ